MSAPHEKFPLWRHAARLTVHVYTVTARFPDTERSGLTGGMRTLAATLAADLAALSETDDDAEALTALRRQRQAMRRLQSHLTLARRLRFTSWYQARQLHRRIERYHAMLDATCHVIEDHLSDDGETSAMRLAA